MKQKRLSHPANESRARKAALAAMIFSLAIVGLAVVSCKKSEQKRYDLKGKVVYVDKKGGAVTVSHEAIPGYMEAMTMPFKLKGNWTLDEMLPGDRVTATLVTDGSRSWLEDAVFVREEVAPPGAGGIQGSPGPEPGSDVPDFSLVNQDSTRIHLRQYRGRALLLTFIYTRCPLPDYCPLMTDNFAEIDRALKADPAIYARTHLLSISVDPDYDTSKILREYGARHTSDGGQPNFEHWEFASGTPEEIKKIGAYFGMSYWQQQDQIIHSLRTALIAPDGKLLKLYHGNEWKPAEILSDFHNLVQVNSAQGKPDQPKQTQPRDQTEASIHHGVGVVESIDKEMETVQINHQELKNFMPAMSMPFKVRDKSLLDAVAPGDEVEFDIQDTASGMIVISLSRKKH